MPGKAKKELKEHKEKEHRAFKPVELPIKVNLEDSDYSSNMLSQSMVSAKKIIEYQTQTFCEQAEAQTQAHHDQTIEG
jgi:hypothetical protein